MLRNWKLRLAQRMYDRAAAEYHRLQLAYCGPFLDTKTPPLILLRRIDDQVAIMVRAERRLRELRFAS